MTTADLKGDLIAFAPITAANPIFVANQVIVAGDLRQRVQRIARIDRQQRTESFRLRRKRDNAVGRSGPGSPHGLSAGEAVNQRLIGFAGRVEKGADDPGSPDRKSTRLNS